MIAECASFGGAVHVSVDKNSADGNVYVKAPTTSVAMACVNSLQGRWFSGITTVHNLTTVQCPEIRRLQHPYHHLPLVPLNTAVQYLLLCLNGGTLFPNPTWYSVLQSTKNIPANLHECKWFPTLKDVCGNTPVNTSDNTQAWNWGVTAKSATRYIICLDSEKRFDIV